MLRVYVVYILLTLTMTVSLYRYNLTFVLSYTNH